MKLLRQFFRRETPFACFGRTDTGRVRSHNEDSFVMLADRNLYVVADGMGGHNAGEVASRVAVENLVRYFTGDLVKKIRGNAEEIQHQLMRAFEETNRLVMEMASENEAHRGMGCTLIVGLIDQKALHTCHVGDVRCYWADEHNVHQITTDHTLTAALENEGSLYPPGERETLVRGRNVVTRAIGFPQRESPEYHRIPIDVGRRLLFCSDGLWSMVDDVEIHDILRSSTSPEQACDRLVKRANEAGGRDNITAVVVFV